MINEDAIKSYLFRTFSDIVSVDIRKLGSGVQGTGFLVEMKTKEAARSYVVKSLIPEGLGHDYPSDRASVFLLDLEAFNHLPRHVKAVDVLAEMPDGEVKSIGGGREYYLLMERGEGRHYFHDLAAFAGKSRLGDLDVKKIKSMTSYLADIHARKKDSKTLYWRKLRDTVGHGECLMGVFDLYPDGTVPYEEMTGIIKKSVDYIYRLKPKYKRLSQIHGDFHPGNIWFNQESQKSEVRNQNPEANSQENKTDNATEHKRQSEADFILLDRSRGPWGEPADDVTALTINYIFFSIRNTGEVSGAYLKGLKLFFDEYIEASGDEEITAVAAPFFAFRAAVVASPVFYPELTAEARGRLITFADRVLSSDVFDARDVNNYLS